MTKKRYIIREYRVGDTTYPNLKELAAAAGISYPAAVKRAHRRWSDAEIFYGRGKLPASLAEHGTTTNRNAIKIGGIEYRCLEHAYDELKPSVSLPAVRSRMNQLGWSCEQAFELEERIDGRSSEECQEKWIVNGTQFKTLREAYNFILPKATFNSVKARLRYGWSLEEALGVVEKVDGRTSPSRASQKRLVSQKRDEIIVYGVKFDTITELARAYDLPPKLVYNRIRGNGWSYERAVSEGISKKVVVDGVLYRSALKAWEAVGKTSYSQYEGRQLKGFPLEVCLGLEALPRRATYEVDGVIFGSLSEVAAAYGLSTQQLLYRLNSMELEDAVRYVPSNGRYSRVAFERDPSLGATTGVLYFVEVQLSDGVLHKIGITAKTVVQRFKGKANGISSIVEYRGTLAELYELEQKVVREFSDYHYRGDDDFEGRTELFLLLNHEVEEIKTYLALNAGSHGAEQISDELRIQSD